MLREKEATLDLLKRYTVTASCEQDIFEDFIVKYSHHCSLLLIYFITT